MQLKLLENVTRKVANIRKFFPGKNVSVIIPVKGKRGQFVITMEKELVLVTWDGESDKPSKIEKLIEVDSGTKNVFNDGKADPTGRLWIGKTNLPNFNS